MLIAGGALTSKNTLGGAFTSTFDTTPDKPDTMAGSAYNSLLVEVLYTHQSVVLFHFVQTIFCRGQTGIAVPLKKIESRQKKNDFVRYQLTKGMNNMIDIAYESFVNSTCMELFGFGKKKEKYKEPPVDTEKVLEYISSPKMAQLINDCEMQYLKYYDNPEYSNLFKMLYGKPKLAKNDLSYSLSVGDGYDSLQELKRDLKEDYVDPDSNEIAIYVYLSDSMQKKGHAAINKYCGTGDGQNLDNPLYQEFKRIDSLRNKQWIGMGTHLGKVPDEGLDFYYNVLTNKCEFEWSSN